MNYDNAQKELFELLNAYNKWEDKCKECCIIKCGLFGDFKNQCHCGNFEDKKCKDCVHQNIVY